MAQCDKCNDEARWVRGNMETGDQDYVCDQHLNLDGSAPQADPLALVTDPVIGPPPQCELCLVEDVVTVWQQPDGSNRQYLGGVCALAIGRAGYLTASAEMQESVSAAVEAIMGPPKNGAKSSRSRNRRVAVGNAGGDGEAVETPQSATAAVGGASDAGEDPAAADPEG